VSVGADSCRDAFGSWLDRVATGQDVVVTRRGKPMVRLTAAAPAMQLQPTAPPPSQPLPTAPPPSHSLPATVAPPVASRLVLPPPSERGSA